MSDTPEYRFVRNASIVLTILFYAARVVIGVGVAYVIFHYAKKW